MENGILFAITAAMAVGLWTVFSKLASTGINQLFGAIVVGLSASLVGIMFLIPKINTVTLFTNQNAILFLILAGICTFCSDYFSLKAYSSGLETSVVGPIIIGGSIAVAVIIGFFLGDKVSLIKILSLILIMIGAVVLSVF